MLHYLYDVTFQLFISVTMITLMFALSKLILGKKGFYIELGGVLAGILAAAYRAIRHAFMSTFDVEINLYTFYVGIIAMVLMLVLIPIFTHKNSPKWGKIILSALGAIISADLLFYKAWKVIWAPAEFETAGNGVISWEFLERLGGWALALILLWVYARFLYMCLRRISDDEALWVGLNGAKLHKHDYTLIGGTSMLSLGLIITNFAGQILRTWRQKSTVRVISETGRRSWVTYYKFRPDWFPVPKAGTSYNTWESNFAMNVGNGTLTFIIVMGIIALIPLTVLFIKSMQKRGLYSNPAQLRRLKSNRRHNRRQVITVIVCFALAIVNLTVVYAIDNRTEPEPEPEQYTISEDGTQVLIPVEQVNDYNLHAFSIVTPNNVTVRWIVIRKPNSGAYGVGLNACDVCGPAGYIQRGDAVICVKCDVQMNTSTIGLSGGCNPVPLSFSVSEGNIVIQMDELIAAESRFKNR